MDSVGVRRSFTLRCKSKNGVTMLTELRDDSTVAELLVEVSKSLKVATRNLKIMAGFPPKAVDLSDGGATLGKVAIKSGDTLTVEIIYTTTDNELNTIVGRNNIREKFPGILIRRTVPSDNSCLFTSVNYVMTGTLDTSSAGPLRKLISEKVSQDPKKYNEAFLGKPNREYCKWILDGAVWGGAIEISLLSLYFAVEIVVVNTQSGGLNRFGEDHDYDRRAFLLYDGIHYDPLVLEVSEPHLSETTVFTREDVHVMDMALEIAQEAYQSRQFTDLRDFTLRCMVCDEPLRGLSQAQQHSKQTGHVNFGEV